MPAGADVMKHTPARALARRLKKLRGAFAALYVQWQSFERAAQRAC
jgi:hypothetical protein